jgi:type III restriction enzyme
MGTAFFDHPILNSPYAYPVQHWRSYNFAGIRPFFCQIEAVETLIWLTEVAPQMEDSVLELTPELTGPTRVLDAGIIGETVELRPENLKDIHLATVAYNLTQRLLETRYRDDDGGIPLYLFGQLKTITAAWLDQCLRCTGGALPGHLLYPELADMACGRIAAAITQTQVGKKPVKAILDPYNSAGSTAHVNFTTTRTERWDTQGPPPKCHLNWIICDSDWEAEFCRAAEANSRVIAYVKNCGLGFEIPYRYQSWTRAYLPDFILLIDDGRPDPLRLVVEVKGYRREDAKEKKLTMETLWIPGVNNLGTWGRWAFAEFTEAFDMEEGLKRLVEGYCKNRGDEVL